MNFNLGVNGSLLQLALVKTEIITAVSHIHFIGLVNASYMY